MPGADLEPVHPPRAVSGWCQTYDYVFGHSENWVPADAQDRARVYSIPADSMVIWSPPRPDAAEAMYQAFGLRVFQLSVFRAATEPFVFPRDELVFAARREQADQCRLVAPPVTVLVQGVPSLTIDVRWMLLGPDSAQARMFALEAWLPHPGNWFLVRCTGPEWFHEEGRAAFLTALGSWHWYR